MGTSPASILRRAGVRNRRNASRPASGTLTHCTRAKKRRSRRCNFGDTPGTTRPRTGLRRSSMILKSMKVGYKLHGSGCGVESRTEKTMRGFMKRTYLIAMGLLAQAASAGVYVEMVDHDIKTDRTELAQKMYVQNGLGRFIDGDGRATLIKDGTLFIIDDADKSYVAVDKATLDQLAKKV